MELHERLRAFVHHFTEIRKGLERAVSAYNRSVGSMESRVLVTARKFKELGASTGDAIQGLNAIDRSVRDVSCLDEELSVDDQDESIERISNKL